MKLRFLFVLLLFSATAFSATYEITNLSWKNLVDKDGDEYTATRTLDFSVAISEGSQSVRVQFYYTPVNGDVWLEGPQTATFTLYNSQIENRSLDIPPLVENGRNQFKCRLVLTAAENPATVLYQLEPADAPVLNYQLFESSADDENYGGKPFIITSTADTGPGTLREAFGVLEPNSLILFNLPPKDSNYDPQRETWAIRLESPLPAINGLTNLIIDGFSQPYIYQHGIGIPIVIDGEQTTTSSGLDISQSQFVYVRGIQVLNFSETGIAITGVDDGIIYQCILGTQPFRVDSPMKFGIYLHDVPGFQIGSGLQIGNYFVGELELGILVSFSAEVDVWDNYFGHTAEWFDTYFGETSVTVGIQAQNNSERLRIFRNHFLDAGHTAIQLLSTKLTQISENEINTRADWAAQLGRYRAGVVLNAKSDENWVNNNTVGYCEFPAILVDGQSVGNRLMQNSLSRNPGGAILLQNGGNADQPGADFVKIENDVLHGLAGPGFFIEFFGDEGEQARVYLGATTVTDGMNFTFDLSDKPSFPKITATVTDLARANTSQLSGPIEWRPLPATVQLVTTTADSVEGSLRAALALAAETATADTILFQIPREDPGFDASSGTWKLQLSSSLFVSADSLWIDGASQAEFAGEDTNPTGPEIVLFPTSVSRYGIGLGFFDCGHIFVRDLVIQDFGENLRFSNVQNGVVEGCFLGTDATGEARGTSSQTGLVAFLCEDLRIGTPDYSRGNLISGNSTTGVVLDSCLNTVIQWNRIGVDRTGTQPLHNDFEALRIKGGSRGTIVQQNLIAGHTFGVRLLQAQESVIRSNFVNTDSTRQIDLGEGAGIILQQSSNLNSIQFNTVQFSQRGVVIADSSVNNSLSRNRISGNQHGIILIEGGNLERSAPVISEVSWAEVSGTSQPGDVIEIFSDSTNQGAQFLGSTTADAEGNFTFQLETTLTWPTFTAIATDAVGNSSGFSWPMTIPANVFNGTDSRLPEQFFVRNSYPNPFNPATTLEFGLPEAGLVKIQIFDVLGREIRTLANSVYPAGVHQVVWQAKNDHGSFVPSGTYFAKCTVGNVTRLQKIVLVR